MDRVTHLLNIFDHTPEGIAILSAQGHVMYRNKMFSRIYPGSAVSSEKWAWCTEKLRERTENPTTLVGMGGEEVLVYQVYTKGGKAAAYYFVLVRRPDLEEIFPHSGEGRVTHDDLGVAFQGLVGEDPQFLQALTIAARAAKSDLPVLIMGESGTGKEIVARAIHETSRRQDRKLVDVNCAAIPDNLIESELFGYDRGAFTGARKEGRHGYFDLAHEGTIFLDEIGDSSLQTQSKLLRVLETGCFKRVGGNSNIVVDVRIISATNQDLRKHIADKTFREDLYYRLNTFTIELPPLRARKSDIPLLVAHFLAATEGEQREMRFLPCTMEILQAYDWPGNVRELRGVVNYAINMSPSRLVAPTALPRFLFAPAGSAKEMHSHSNPAASEPLPIIYVKLSAR